MSCCKSLLHIQSERIKPVSLLHKNACFLHKVLVGYMSPFVNLVFVLYQQIVSCDCHTMPANTWLSMKTTIGGIVLATAISPLSNVLERG